MPSARQMRAARELGDLTRPDEPLRPGRRPPPKELPVPQALLLGNVEWSQSLDVAELETRIGELVAQGLPPSNDDAASPSDDVRECLARAVESGGLSEEYGRSIAAMLDVVEQFKGTGPDSEQSVTLEVHVHARLCIQELIAPGAADATLLKVALAILWVGRHQPDGLLPEIPAALYAEALGLPDPDTRGARRVREAQKRLADLHLITRRSRRPRATELRLIDSDGAPFPPPNPQRDALVPHTLFTSGWIAALGGPALVALTHIVGQRLGHHRGRRPGATELRRRSGLSKAAWYLGIDELLNYGLLSRRQFEQSRSADRYFGRRRYEILREGLRRDASQRRVTEWRNRRAN